MAVDAELAAGDTDQHLVLDHRRCRGARLAFRRIAVLCLPDHLPVLGIERDQRGVGLMQEDLPVGIGKPAIDRIATHHRNDVRILLGLVFPEDLGVVVEVERVDRIRERSMDVHDVADHERPAFVAAQNAGRKRPRHLQFAHVCGGDLLELRVTVVGVISCRHHPLFWVLRHFDEFIVGMSGAHSEHRYGAHASRQ